MKKTTIWISNDLTPRHSVNGWPEKPPLYFTHYVVNGEVAETGQRAAELYCDALAKAKEESIPFESHAALYPTMNLSTTPDSFLEIDGEVEVFKQYRNASGVWVDTDFIDPYVMAQYQTRTVARLKPAEAIPARTLPTQFKPCQYCGAHENHDCQHGGGSCPWAEEAASDDWIKPSEADGPSIKVYGQGFHIEKMKPAEAVNIVPVNQHVAIGWMQEDPSQHSDTALNSANSFTEVAYPSIELAKDTVRIMKERDTLKQQLAAAQDRIKILENDLLDALDLKKGNGPTALSMLQERVKELEDIFEAEWTKSSDVKPPQNRAVEVFIPEEDNHVTVGIWDISEKWVLLDEYRTPQSEVTYWRWLREEPEDKSYTPTEDYEPQYTITKAKILEAFANALSETGTPGYCCNRLSEVLDELGIK